MKNLKKLALASAFLAMTTAAIAADVDERKIIFVGEVINVPCVIQFSYNGAGLQSGEAAQLPTIRLSDIKTDTWEGDKQRLAFNFTQCSAAWDKNTVKIAWESATEEGNDALLKNLTGTANGVNVKLRKAGDTADIKMNAAAATYTLANSKVEFDVFLAGNSAAALSAGTIISTATVKVDYK